MTAHRRWSPLSSAAWAALRRGEFQAAEKMVQAAAMIAQEPIALQLRYLQTMREIASEHNTTTFLPIPIDLFTPFLKGAGKV